MLSKISRYLNGVSECINYITCPCAFTVTYSRHFGLGWEDWCVYLAKRWCWRSRCRVGCLRSIFMKAFWSCVLQFDVRATVMTDDHSLLLAAARICHFAAIIIQFEPIHRTNTMPWISHLHCNLMLWQSRYNACLSCQPLGPQRSRGREDDTRIAATVLSLQVDTFSVIGAVFLPLLLLLLLL